jgi:Cu2+-exporting ATPase
VFVVSNALRLRTWKPSGKLAGKATEAATVVGTTPQESPEGTEGATEMKQKKLNVDGMMCEHCVAHVTKALEGVKGVKNVQVSLEDGTAVLDAGLLVSDKSLVAAVEEAGYKAVMA